MRVLLVRLDGIGDAAVCVPLLAALREAGHEVGVALTTRNAGVFAPHVICAEHVLERIPWPAHGSSRESTARAKREIASQRYDVALIATEEPEGYELAAGIPTRVGFTTGWARPLKTLWARMRLTRAIDRSQRIGGEPDHEVEVMFRLGRALVDAGAPPRERALLRGVLVSDARAVRRNDGPILQAGPKWGAIGVSATALRELTERLRPYGLRIVAAPGEAEAVRDALGVLPQTFADVRAWVDSLDGASTVITVDTGAAHVAGMLGRDVIDVFPDAHFEAQVRRWRPWSSAYRALRASELRGGTIAALAERVLDGF